MRQGGTGRAPGDDGTRTVVVIGLGYVGLPLAMRAVAVGHRVVGVDLDRDRIKFLLGGESYIDDVSDADVADALASERFRPTGDATDAAGFDVAVITVPTPLRDGNPDLSYIESAARSLAPHIRAGALVVLESTTYPGTTEEIVAPILEEGSGLVAGSDFRLGYSPERIDPGNPVWSLVNTPKVVSGVDEGSRRAVDAFYRSIVDRTVPVSGTREAELTKLLENTYRHVNVALVNELAVFAADLGIDIWEVLEAAGTKPFGFQRFDPGPGVGGHCLPIDPSYLSWRVRRTLGRPFRFVELANDVNDHMPDYVVQRLALALNRRRRAINGSTILLVGLAYKRNCGDAREAPALAVAARLLDLGATVWASDPHVVEAGVDERIRRRDLTARTLAAADAVVVLTDHDVFDRALIVEHASCVLDTRHFVEPGPDVEHL